MKFDFFSEPTAVIEYIRSKRPELHFDYDEIMHATHHRVFTVAKITKIDLLSDIQESLAYAAKDGLGFKEWKKHILPTLAKKGWLGSIEVKNPKTGELKDIYVGSRRLKNIYSTNMRVAYAASRYETQMNSDAEFLRYVAVIDGKTRADHRALHGLILPKNHKFWDTHYPPNAWNCRCQARSYTKKELDGNGWSVSNKIPNIDPHEDWAYNVGKTDNLYNVLAQKIAKLPKNSFKKRLEYELENLKDNANFYTWKQNLNRAINELIIKKDVRSPINVFQIGIVSEFIAKKVKEILNLELKDAHIMADKKAILHVRPERKGKYGQALSIDEMLHIPQVLLEAKSVSVDKENMNLIYWFDDKTDGKFINKIAVDLNYTLKKFGVTNYMVTIGKVNKDDLSRQEIIKIR